MTDAGPDPAGPATTPSSGVRAEIASIETEEPPRSPLQVIHQIRFELDQLGSQNAQYRFEDICRHFARNQIAPNILPSTGPVGVGGDRGRDFETFRSYMQEHLDPGGFAGALGSGQALAFICTLQRENLKHKLLADAAKIQAAGVQVASAYAFVVVPVPKATRDGIQDEAREKHGLHLEIIDVLALAESLATPKLFWIATELLSIPAHLAPIALNAAVAEAGGEFELPDWYADARARWVDRDPVPLTGELVDVITGLRYATFEAEARGDLPFWLERIAVFDSDDAPEPIRQRARYESAAANLRGLGDLRPADHATRAFLAGIVAEDELDPSRLEDAANLLGYAGTAVSFGHSELDPQELHDGNVALRDRIRRELSTEPPPTRRARLLEVLGRLAIIPDPNDLGRVEQHPGKKLNAAQMIDEASETGVPEDVVARLPSFDIEEAINAWRDLATALPDTPLYPVESWARVLEFFAPLLRRHDGWREIEHAVDDALARLHGGNAAAVRARDRGLVLLENGALLEALEEMHRATDSWWSGDSLRGALLSMLMVAEIYLALGLPQAAKQHALAVATGASMSGDDGVKDLVAHAIFEVARIEHTAGAWISAAEYIDVGLLAQAALIDPETDAWAENDLAAAVTHLGTSLRAARTLAPGAEARLKEIAQKHGMLGEMEGILDEAGELESDEWARLADEQLLGRPFNDLGAERRLRFAASGVTWLISSGSDYRLVHAAERIAAALQIVLVELTAEELCLLPVEAEIQVRLKARGPRQERLTRDGSDRGWRWTLDLNPPAEGGAVDVEHHFVETTACVASILGRISLLPGQVSLDAVLGAFERGLGGKLARGRPYEEMAELVSESRYDATARSGEPPLDGAAPAPTKHRKLAAARGPGPGYSTEKAKEAIRARYERIPPVVAYSLAQLVQEPEFNATVEELRSQGWRDWHILNALGTIVFNQRLAREGLNRPDAIRAPGAQERVKELVEVPEAEDDPRLALTDVGIDQLTLARRISIPAYARGWGLDVTGYMSDMEAVEQFLDDRYRYWSDDAEHADPFASPSVPA